MLSDEDFLAFLPLPGEDFDVTDALPLADRLAEADDPREAFFRRLAADEPGRRRLGTVLCMGRLTPCCTVGLAALCAGRAAPYLPDEVEVSLLVRHPDHPGVVQDMFAVATPEEAAPLARALPEDAKAAARRRFASWRQFGQIPAGWLARLFGQ